MASQPDPEPPSERTPLRRRSYVDEVTQSPEYIRTQRQRPQIGPVLSAVHGQEDGVPPLSPRSRSAFVAQPGTPTIEVTRPGTASVDDDPRQDGSYLEPVSRVRRKSITRLETKASDVSSICPDRGDHLRIGTKDRVSIADSSTWYESDPDTSQDVIGSGGWGPDNWPEPEMTVLPVSNSLQLELRNAFYVRKNKQEFLPLDKLDAIVNKTTVRTQLHAHYPTLTSLQLDYCVEKICHQQKPYDRDSKRLKFTSLQRIFAILALIEKLGTIISFIKEEICDMDLPFVPYKPRNANGDYGTTELRSRRRPNKPILSFEGWGTFSLEAFRDNQWRVLAPFFAKGGIDRVLFYPLEPQDILPFEDVGADPTEFRSGFSVVKKVHIHPAHHNFEHATEPNPPFAVKRLNSTVKQEFDNEVEILKRYSNRQNNHLVKLLATYSQDDHYYLVFPWADGNLREFWKLHPLPNFSDERIRWLAEQCRAIAVGLADIHSYTYSTNDRRPKTVIGPDGMLLPPVVPVSPMPEPGASDTDDEMKPFGKHGDIKPENILWFKDYDEHNNIGILKISDFGLSRFDKLQYYMQAAKVQVSPTYRAPEVDVETHVGRSYDIWTLGCLYLEFITWFLMGWEAVNETFSKNRTSGRGLASSKTLTSASLGDDIPEDTFFFVYHKNNERRAALKPAVREWIADLHSHPKCTAYIHDFLDFIQEHMLTIAKKDRAPCSQVVLKLRELEDACKSTHSYCTEGIPWPQRQGSIQASEPGEGEPGRGWDPNLWGNGDIWLRITRLSPKSVTITLALSVTIAILCMAALLYDWAEDPFVLQMGL